MTAAAWLAAWALAASLSLPPPGTDSRERRFCRAWLALPPPLRQQVLIDADARETDGAEERACRERLRPALRHRIDAECANWPELMDFEVRAIAEAAFERCRR